jgi:Protein of unknown function (DUF3305)
MASAVAERITVGIVLEHRRLANPWAADRWRVVDALPGCPAVQPWTVLAEGDGWRRYYAGPVELELFRGETASYRDNLASSRPALYVVLRRTREGPGIAVREATVDPGEIEAHSDAGDDLIEALPLPAPIAAWVEDFVARHHVERAFYKRRRDRADTEALARGRVADRPGGQG